MNVPKGWLIVRSEPYGTLFNCEKGHPKFLPIGELIPAACPYCALVDATTPAGDDPWTKAVEEAVITEFESDPKTKTQAAPTPEVEPMTPEAIIALIGHNYDTMEPVGDDGRPIGDLSRVRYSLSVHDLMSAFTRPVPSDEDYAELYRLREEVKGPDGFATWKDAALAERLHRPARSELVKAAQDVVDCFGCEAIDVDAPRFKCDVPRLIKSVKALYAELNKVKS